jgi:hypothetical protein
MDLHYYRQRERAERLAAEQAAGDSARDAHLHLAESYRSVIEAYEKLEALRPAPRSVA